MNEKMKKAGCLMEQLIVVSVACLIGVILQMGDGVLEVIGLAILVISIPVGFVVVFRLIRIAR